MSLGWIRFVIVFYSKTILQVLLHHVWNFGRGLFLGLGEFYNEVRTKYVYLKPSDINYNSDYIGKDTGKGWDGTRISIFDELREGLYRYTSADEISCNVVVVRDKSGRGRSMASNSSSACNAWWVVRGNEELWVLKRLEEKGHLKYAKFRALPRISDELWNSMCHSRRSHAPEAGGQEFTGVEYVQEEEEFKKTIQEYKNHLAPEWSKVYSSSEGTRSLRLADYEDEKERRNDVPCIRGGLCHMVEKDYERQIRHYASHEEMDAKHTCMRKIKIGTKAESLTAKEMYQELTDFRQIFWIFSYALIIALIGGCCLGGCGTIIGKSIDFSKINKTLS